MFSKLVGQQANTNAHQHSSNFTMSLMVSALHYKQKVCGWSWCTTEIHSNSVLLILPRIGALKLVDNVLNGISGQTKLLRTLDTLEMQSLFFIAAIYLDCDQT